MAAAGHRQAATARVAQADSSLHLGETVTVGIVIAAGGTAGHVYPGLAAADAIRRVRPDTRISFVGTPRGIEREAVPAAGYELDLIEVIPWARTLGARRFLAPASLLGAASRARGLLAARRPAAVVGMGGYASLPVVLAARWRRLPAVLHEQNAVAGIANVAGSRFARRVALSFAEARGAFPRGAEIRVLGNPIRAAIAALDRAAVRDEGLAFHGLEAGRRTVLVMGGSLGATRLNEVAVGLTERWRDRSDLQLLVSAGRGRGAEVGGRFPRGGALRTVAVDYLERVELAYAAADVALCRAGATTVAELSAVGLPSILVPYPYARANHQEANARALERAGGARVVLDADATAATIGPMLESILDENDVTESMTARARAFGKPEAADELAAWALSLGEPAKGSHG
jgi:UDP-N-acetylglucosamine--N-acetylmuramyl-(pentapeptide) pyrophosphoryl-undecaprenol N-acetylglucosamine transferase